MALSLQTVRRLTIEARQTGFPEVTAAHTALERAQTQLSKTSDGLALATDRAAKRQLSAAAEYDRLRMRVDETARQQAMFTKGQATLDRAFQQGVIEQREYDKTSQLLIQRYGGMGAAANDNAKKIGLNSHEMKNLGFQVNDVATMLAMGASPFQILASQGGQVLQILQGANGGVTGALKDMAARTLAFLGPLGLMAAGLAAAGAAAYGLYSVLKSRAPEAEQLLAEHDRLLRVVKESYDKTANAARNWYNESKNVTQLQLLQQEIDLQNKLKEAVGQTIQKMTQSQNLGGALNGLFPGLVPENMRGMIVVREQYALLEEQIIRLQQGFKNGRPDVKAFLDEIAQVALVNPALQKSVTDLISSMGDTTKLANSLQQTRDLLNGLKTGTFGKDERNRLGFGAETAASSINAYDSLIQRTKDRIVELQFEATAAGQTEGAVRALRLQHEAERAAKKAGVDVNQAVLDQLKQEIVLLEQQKQQRDALRQAQQSADFERATLFMSPGEQNIASTMQSIYREGWQSQMDSALAVQMRLTNSLREYGDVGRSVFTSVGQAMRDGKITSQEWSSILDNLSSRLIDLAMNSAWDSLIGGRRGGGGGLFGLLGGLFGGGSNATDGIGGFGPTAPSGFAEGGYTGHGHRFQPAGIVHAGEFVFDATSTARAGVANLYAMQSALRGYDRGVLVTAGAPWMPPSGDGGRPTAVQIDASDNRVIHIGAGASAETVSQLKAELARDRAERKSHIISVLREARSGNVKF